MTTRSSKQGTTRQATGGARRVAMRFGGGVLLALASACAAKYQTVHKQLASEETAPGPASSGDATPGQAAAGQPPTAGVELLVDAQATAKVPVGKHFVLRPTASTLDPDAAGTSLCLNPGIVDALYKISDGKELESSRTTGCDDLGTGATMATPGRYTVTLLVRSSDGGRAQASLSFVVYDPATTGGVPATPPSGGFIVSADPMVTTPGSVVHFDGDCGPVLGVAISWDFGDGATGVGAVVDHAYASPGQYPVAARCVHPQAGTLTGLVTVSIVPANSGNDAGATSSTSTSTSTTSTNTGIGTGTGTGTGTSPSTGNPSNSGTDTGTGTPGQTPNQGKHG